MAIALNKYVCIHFVSRRRNQDNNEQELRSMPIFFARKQKLCENKTEIYPCVITEPKNYLKKLFQLGPITLETKEKSGNSLVSLLPKLGAFKKSLCAKAPFPGGRGATTIFPAREEEEKKKYRRPLVRSSALSGNCPHSKLTRSGGEEEDGE